MEQLLTNSDFRSFDTADRIRRIFIESLRLNLSEEDFSYEAKLDESAGLDSVAVLEFVIAVEQDFGITFEPEMLSIDSVRDLKQLAAYVDERTAWRQAPPLKAGA